MKESMDSAASHVFSCNNMKLDVLRQSLINTLCSLVEFLKIVPIMLALCLILLVAYYAYYYAGIIGQSSNYTCSALELMCRAYDKHFPLTCHNALANQ